MQEAKTYVICLSHIFFPGSNILILISRSNSTSSFNFWFNDYSKQSVTISLFPSTVVCSTGSDQISVVILSFSLKMIYHHLTLIMHVYSYSTTQTKKVLNLITKGRLLWKSKLEYETILSCIRFSKRTYVQCVMKYIVLVFLKNNNHWYLANNKWIYAPSKFLPFIILISFTLYFK